MRHFNKISLLSLFTLILVSCFVPVASAESASIKQSEATVELTSGLLTLDYVPLIDFGTHEIVDTMIYESTTLEPFIQVSDRRGTGQGWSVTAKASHFTNDDSIESLQGAKVIFSNGEAVSTGHVTGVPPSTKEVVLYTGGDAVTVVTAAVDTGLGTWMNRWLPTGGTEGAVTNDNVTLDIPSGSATIGKHKAVITWTLTDAPGQ